MASSVEKLKIYQDLINKLLQDPNESQIDFAIEHLEELVAYFARCKCSSDEYCSCYDEEECTSCDRSTGGCICYSRN